MKNTWLLRLSIVINFLLIIPVNNAQNSSMSFLDDVMEDISVNNDEEEELNWENVIEELSERIQQPVNLNSATKEQLEQFPFLNDIQIENLLAYVYIDKCRLFMNYSWWKKWTGKRFIIYFLLFVYNRFIRERLIHR